MNTAAGSPISELLVFTAVLVGPLCVQAAERSPSAIVGGNVSDSCAWPSVASLEGECTATLVHNRVLLYAAHCGTEFRQAGFGESEQSPSHVAEIEYCKAMSNGKPGAGNDLAFCMLTQDAPVPFSSIASAAASKNISTNSEITLVGFGLDETFESGVKREVRTRLHFTSSSGEFFIGGDGRDSCWGDSGGPAFVEDAAGDVRVLGVASHGRECGDGGYYAPAWLAIDWIEGETGFSLQGATEHSASQAEWMRVCDSGAELTGCMTASTNDGTRGLLPLLALGFLMRRRSRTTGIPSAARHPPAPRAPR